MQWFGEGDNLVIHIFTRAKCLMSKTFYVQPSIKHSKTSFYNFPIVWFLLLSISPHKSKHDIRDDKTLMIW